MYLLIRLASPLPLKVEVGATKLSEGIIHSVDKIIQHPNYTVAEEYVSLDYDIAILKVMLFIVTLREFHNST